jgi:hypothetical protein
MTKTTSHLITSHSCHEWIFRLTRNMITKFLQNLYRERYIAGSSNWTTRELSINIATILSAVTGGLQSSSDKVYLRSSFNQIWILTYCEDLQFWVVLILVFILENFMWPKHWLLQITNHFFWKYIKEYKEIIYI